MKSTFSGILLEEIEGNLKAVPVRGDTYTFLVFEVIKAVNVCSTFNVIVLGKHSVEKNIDVLVLNNTKKENLYLYYLKNNG